MKEPILLARDANLTFLRSGASQNLRCPDQSWSRSRPRNGSMEHITKASLASTRSTIRVIIADGHPVAREGLSAVLGLAPDFQVVAQAADGMEACELYHQYSPDVLLVDIRMPGKDGFQVVEELMARRGTRPRIIVITTYESEDDIRRAVTAGAHGYLVKVAEPQQIREAIRQVAAGRTAFPTWIALDLARTRPEC